MRYLRVYLLVALATSLAGCAAIYSEQPLGNEAVVLDPAEVNGTWLGPGDLMRVRVLDNRSDTFIYWTLRRQSSKRSAECAPPRNVPTSCFDGEAAGTCTVTVSRHVLDGAIAESAYGRSAYFFSAQEKRMNRKVHVTRFLGLSDEKSVAVLYPIPWLGDVSPQKSELNKRLKALIEKGALPGHVDPDGMALLGALSQAHYQLIVSPDSGVFNWTMPMPYIKLPDELDPCKKGAKAE